MLTQQIATQIDTEEVKFRAGHPVSWEITATNHSDRLASFWLEIKAAGVESTNPSWYRVSPGISTLIPPGDSTKFRVTAIASPIPNFFGQIDLTHKIFSLELNTEERQLVRLIVERSENERSLQLDVPTSATTYSPASAIELPYRVFNSSQKPLDVTLSLLGLNPQWFDGKTEHTFTAPPEQWLSGSFQGRLPDTTELLAQDYPYKIAILQPEPDKTNVAGQITILPQGTVKIAGDRLEGQIPERRAWLPNWRDRSTDYQFQVINHSNLNQQVDLNITVEDDDYWWESTPVELDLGETDSTELTVTARRSWWGWQQNLELPIKGVLSDPRIAIDNPQQDLTLTVHPILPTWLQAAIALLLLGGSWWLWMLLFRLPPHKERINAIDVNGMGDRVVSVSNDRTIRRWQVAKFRPRSSKVLGSTPKSIRSVRYQPVNNNRIAVGLQNGEVQLWDLLSQSAEPLLSLSDNRADRVLDLAFTPDSQYLFSGHGSGLILQWDITTDTFGEIINKPVKSKQLSPPSAIYGLEMVGEGDTLAIAGQYNDLMLWNWQQDNLATLNYRPGGKDDYITSLATADGKPWLLATGDNQGAISLWNLQPCLTASQPCQLLDFWQNGHAERPIRSVSLSADGCYLASSGDDGRLKLWDLDATAQRKPRAIDGKVIAVKTEYNSIDLQAINSQLQITTGDDDGRVRVYRADANNSDCQ